ncbi:chemotaxis protein histidine kinase-like protein [Synechococcus sp. PCC 7502]|uniref:hybrid sensor histidine kinase/response regulator n=1 Tax=Synechococcus sp. PCC 7502 TaxID=1173263 RepID=UPI00029F8BFA|nr:hybrid sensor histidine kinase/response regulator [Synechococcus sp. PCC 7502]AFY74175.1 chemotaxis protein histidine kinase-like protein [Synechococcus sp. PCC 7502]
MMIEDEELRNLYKVASSEHIHKIEAGILRLEKNPKDTAQLEELLREAHSLKGDSRMLGVSDVETLIHQIEDIFVNVKKGETILTSDLCDRLYQGLDAVTKIAHEAITGEPANVEVFYTLAQLMGADIACDVESNPMPTEMPLPETQGNDLDAMFADLENPPLAPEAVTIAESEVEALMNRQWGRRATDPQPDNVPIEGDYQIDTLRVDSSRLDRLLTQASELMVTKGRFSDRTRDLQAVQSLWEEWKREAFSSRITFDELERRLQTPDLLPIQKFYHQVDKRLEQLGIAIAQLKNATYDDTARLEIISNDLESGIRTLRLLPMSTIFNLLPRSVRDLSKQLGKEVELIVEGGDILADKQILEAIKAPLGHLIRNAIDHGIESPRERQIQGKPAIATIRLRAYQSASSVCIEVQDDGQGIDTEAIKRTALERRLHTEAELATMSTAQIQSLIFTPGFSTRSSVSEISGRGVGLDVVRANVERLKGSLQLESTPGQGCLFRFILKPSLATTYVVIVEVDRTTYALPLDSVQTMLLISPENIFAIEGKQTMMFKGEPISLVWLADLLELSVPVTTKSFKNLPCIIMQIGTERLGVLVDALLEQQDIVMKPQSKLLQRVRNIAGATIRGNGEVCMILHPPDLFKSAKQGNISVSVQELSQQVQIKPKILLCDDSIPIRTQLKRILEGYGYDVTPAVDGQDGFTKLRSGKFDAVVSDVQMPNLDGLGLTTRIRQFREYDELPIVLITTLASDEDKRLGAQAGANAYLTKGNFDQRVLLDTLRRLI